MGATKFLGLPLRKFAACVPARVVVFHSCACISGQHFLALLVPQFHPDSQNLPLAAPLD